VQRVFLVAIVVTVGTVLYWSSISNFQQDLHIIAPYKLFQGTNVTSYGNQ